MSALQPTIYPSGASKILRMMLFFNMILLAAPDNLCQLITSISSLLTAHF